MEQPRSSSEERSYWFVGASWADAGDQSARFVREGIWENGYDDRYLDEVREMRPGELIAIKSSFTQKHNLPFENYSHTISAMRIKAIGTIVENPGNGKVVKVEWRDLPSRDWYFYTNRLTVWRVRGVDPESRELIRFAFEGGSQNYERWREHPSWRDRLRPSAEFEWTVFYEALAQALRRWRNRRAELVAMVHKTLAEVGLSPLIDQFSDGRSGPLQDIDPFTFFGIFNRRITDERRKLIAARFAELLEVADAPPEFLGGIPLLNPQKSWFFHYAKERDALAIERLWEVFDTALELSLSDNEDSRADFAAAFDAALADKGVRFNLTIGLFWIGPWRFPSLDTHTRRAIAARLSMRELTSPPDGRAYLEIADVLLHRFQPGSDLSSFPQLVRDSWGVGSPGDEEADESGDGEEGAGAADAQGPAISDRYRTQADDPARLDALERGPFAAVLAARIVEIRSSDRSEDDRAFMVHVHGPWGSGKSSVLNLLQQKLEYPETGSDPSLVVWFNAWKHQRMRPPWWALMSAIYRTAVKQCYVIGSAGERNRERRALQLLWWKWKLRADWGPLLLAAAVLLVILSLALASRTLQITLTTVAALLAASAAIYAYARPALFGSLKAAQTYSDLSTDAYGPVVTLFGKLVGTIRPPLVVFIDDLDRCESDYVVELLEGIQTLFRGAPVTYVVAADRKWICSSFERKYADFAAPIGEPGRPLGYLFLDKLFQISAEMPWLTGEIKERYLKGLLREGDPAVAAEPGAAAAAETRLRGVNDEEGMQRVIEDAADESFDRQQALRAAAAVKIVSAQSLRDTEHRLQKFAHLLEPNPRSMKRLVNAVGMAQARGILEGRSASPEIRARWAMLSLRWPVLAEYIADNPNAICQWRKEQAIGEGGAAAAAKQDPALPAAIKALHGNRWVMEVVGGSGDEGALTRESLELLLG